MKHLSQIIALNLSGFGGLQIMLALGNTVLLLQVLVKKFLEERRCKARKENQEIDSHLCLIE